MVSTIVDFPRYGQMLLNGGTLDGKTYLRSAVFAAMTKSGRGSGVARDYFYYPGEGLGFGYGFGVRTDPGNAVPPRRARSERSNGTARPAFTSWSTARRICSSFDGGRPIRAHAC